MTSLEDFEYTLTRKELRSIKAEAWSEGYQDGWSDRGHPGEDRFRNPYREEL